MPNRIFKSFFFLKFSNNQDRSLADRIERITGVYPKNIHLYKQAFRHSSLSPKNNPSISNNERLEYLGDAVLGTIVAEYLFKQYPFKDEGFLTQLRSRIVNRSQLNKIAVKLGLNEILETDSKNLIFVGASMYGNAFEALVGAIFLDKGYNSAKKFIIGRILKFHVDLHDLEHNDPDFKSRLIQYCQKEKLKFNFIQQTKEESNHENFFSILVEIEGEIIANFQHPSKRKAEQFAAEIALEKLNKKNNA